MPLELKFEKVVVQFFFLFVGLLCIGLSLWDMATGGAGDPGTQIQSGFTDGFMFLLGFMVLLGALLIPYYRKEAIS